jgi:hypothetical protein
MLRLQGAEKIFYLIRPIAHNCYDWCEYQLGCCDWLGVTVRTLLVQHIYLDEQAPVAALAFHPLEHALAVVPTDPNSKVVLSLHILPHEALLLIL